MTHGIASDMNSGLTQEYLREVLSYDELTGIFVWRKNTGKKRMAGKVAGNLTKGYWEIAINYRQFKAHRLAWLYVYGEWPKTRDIDHINLDKLDNRIANLREATRAQNNVNAPAQRNSKSGVSGVGRHSQTNKWRAYITVNKRQKSLGLFDSFDEACAARKLAEQEHYGEFSRAA